MTSRETYIAANRAAWDASAPHHRRSGQFAQLSDGFARPGYSCLDAILTERLTALEISGKSVAQLCCNNGRELLSIRNLGAGRCVGFDQSAAFLRQARELAEIAGHDCQFVETDVHAISAAYDAAFDLVVVTIGVFGWMPDLAAFLAVAARLLRPGGALVVYEQHPIMNMVEPSDAIDPHRLIHSYFESEPFVEQGAIVYDGTVGVDGPIHYWFGHSLGDIITGVLDQGLVLRHFREYPHNISSDDFDIYNNRPAQLPQCYTLVAAKPHDHIAGG